MLITFSGLKSKPRKKTKPEAGSKQAKLVWGLVYSSALKMEVTYSSETSVGS
jgi:hypothetical protein